MTHTKSLLTVMACVLVLGGSAIGQDWKPVWKGDSTSAFEVGTQLRPWTIRDEGIDAILDNCQSMAAINNIYVIVVMHQEHRPFHARKFPHNPARSTFQAEDSRISFFPDMKRYGKIKPVLSDHEWIRKTDWLRLVVKACRKRKLGVGAEVSHFPIPKSLIRKNPDWQQKTIDGKGRGIYFCPHHPDVRKHLLGLFGDIAANYDLDYIQTCQFVFNSNDIDKGGCCFCPHCITAAKRTGFDLKAAIPVLRANKNAQPQRDKWLAFRTQATTALYREIAETIRKANPNCHLRLNDVYTWGSRDPSRTGLDIQAVGRHLGSLVNQDHQEQLGRANEDFAARKKWLTANRKHLGATKPLISGIAARMKASPALVRRGIKAAVQHPARVNGLALKHYDGASFSLLRSFKQGMIEAGVRGLTPTIGKEIEEMKLKGYKPFVKEIAEEWGVETATTGQASCTFDQPSGVYDIRITYFDEKDGRSRIKLLIAGTERASFKLDEDCDCWRWRRFKRIRISKGDTITLIGQADKTEQARLDYIEFVPQTK